MAQNKYRYFILTGEPGVGKTTLIKKLSSVFASKGIKTSGFYTEEVRTDGVRDGFDIVTLDGLRGHLAKDQSLLSHPVKHKVGKYGVLLQDFENIALPYLTNIKENQSQLLVIDEIGKMELFSEAFKTRIKDIFRQNSNFIVLATVPLRKVEIVESIKQHRQTKLWTVTRDNRNNIEKDIIKEIEYLFKVTLL